MRKVVGKEVYGFAIMAAVALIICGVGLAFIIIEKQKRVEQRSPGKIIMGICIASGGSFVMMCTIFFLMLNKQ